MLIYAICHIALIMFLCSSFYFRKSYLIIFMESLVTIIMPAFNSEAYISCAIKSVQQQTYRNWELIVVDDCSTDNTCTIVENLQKDDDRIFLYKQQSNSGAAQARNRALKEAKGRFITYLDADDVWFPQKLERQIEFMFDNNYVFTCTSYEVIDDNGCSNGKQVYMLPSVDYKGFLTYNLLQTVGIAVDTEYVDKSTLVMPNLRRRQDAATWLQILKSGVKCYGIHEVLAQYRHTKNSLSSNKLKAVKGVWFLYRKVEKLPLAFSCYCFVRYAFLAVWKRI